MKLEEYKAGEYKQGTGYKAFLPSNINYNWGWDDTKLDSLLAEANRQINKKVLQLNCEGTKGKKEVIK